VNRIHIVTNASRLVLLGLTMQSGVALSQQPADQSLDQQLAGAWTYVSVDTVRPDGSRMLPYPMPWPSYASLSAADLSAVVAYLRTVPPISNRIPAPTRPNIVSYLWGKFQLLILKKDMPLVTYPGNVGSGGGE